MVRKCRFAIAAALASAVYGAGIATAVAQTECDLRISELQRPRLSDLRYDIFAAEPVSGVGRISVERLSPGPCALVLTLSSRAPGSQRVLAGSGGSLIYVVRENTPSRLVVSNTDSVLDTNVFRAVIPDTVDEVTLEFIVDVPAGQLVRSGRYDDTIQVALYDDVVDVLRDRGTISLNLNVVEQVDVSVSSASPEFSLARTFEVIDFGTLETNEIQTAFVTVRSTEDFQLFLRSENDGRMVHERGGDFGAIDYSVTLDGRPLGRPEGLIEAADGRGPTGGIGEAYSIEIQIGEVEQRPAGLYEDRLRVRVASPGVSGRDAQDSCLSLFRRAA